MTLHAKQTGAIDSFTGKTFFTNATDSVSDDIWGILSLIGYDSSLSGDKDIRGFAGTTRRLSPTTEEERLVSRKSKPCRSVLCNVEIGFCEYHKMENSSWGVQSFVLGTRNIACRGAPSGDLGGEGGGQSVLGDKMSRGKAKNQACPCSKKRLTTVKKSEQRVILREHSAKLSPERRNDRGAQGEARENVVDLRSSKKG